MVCGRLTLFLCVACTQLKIYTSPAHWPFVFNFHFSMHVTENKNLTESSACVVCLFASFQAHRIEHSAFHSAPHFRGRSNITASGIQSMQCCPMFYKSEYIVVWRVKIERLTVPKIEDSFFQRSSASARPCVPQVTSCSLVVFPYKNTRVKKKHCYIIFRSLN